MDCGLVSIGQKQPIDCCDKGVGQYRVHSNTKRLLKFLSGLNEEYESIKRDILKEVLIPSVETAYGMVKKEAARRKIMPPSSNLIADGHGGADSSPGGIGHGFAAQGQRQPQRSGAPRPTATHRPETNRRTNQSCGVLTVECKNTRVKLVSSFTGIRIGGRKDKQQEPRWRLESPPGMRRQTIG